MASRDLIGDLGKELTSRGIKFGFICHPAGDMRPMKIKYKCQGKYMLNGPNDGVASPEEE